MYRRKPKRVERPVFPNTIEGFGYIVKENGEIRSKENDTPYEFQVIPKDQSYNEARYKAFIDLVGDLVEERLQNNLGFKKVIVPVNADPSKNEPHSYIYMTPNALTTMDKLAILFPGHNNRIGQWSKRAMCDENIESGSMIRVSRLLQSQGYEVILLNSNGNFWVDNKTSVRIPFRRPVILSLRSFQILNSKAQANRMAVIANGWGGSNFTDLLNNHFDFIKSRVRAVTIANSTHTLDLIHGSDKRAWMIDNVVNWSVGQEAKGEVINDRRFGCTCLSAAVELADFVLPSCLPEMLRFIGVKMGEITEMENESDGEEDGKLTAEEEAEVAAHLNVVSIG
ncbi:hypothetical protein EC973_004324 [Apophysomyces ossiformis]|uniref:Arb2 domain-containing protein n=1 Tax=Apophysomyces ossiformis TaxID=679940 RepID=A0A8H7BQ94_9FUNG|nr:hypothetical protein EC973_004324 [Apophysomyces ossiformis]